METLTLMDDLTHQTHLFDAREAKETARSTDPSTSKAAGVAAAQKRRPSQLLVLAQFKLYGDMHDKQLVEVVHAAQREAGRKLMSESGIRSRRSELAKPNMDRFLELMGKKLAQYKPRGLLHAHEIREIEEGARADLRREGFRSELWDTGRREKVDGHSVIVWGIAR